MTKIMRRIRRESEQEEDRRGGRRDRRARWGGERRRGNECNNLIMKTLPNNNIDVHLHNVASY